MCIRDRGRDRGQRDIALIEGELEAQHIGAIPSALADDAKIRDQAALAGLDLDGESVNEDKLAQLLDEIQEWGCLLYTSRCV